MHGQPPQQRMTPPLQKSVALRFKDLFSCHQALAAGWSQSSQGSRRFTCKCARTNQCEQCGPGTQSPGPSYSEEEELKSAGLHFSVTGDWPTGHLPHVHRGTEINTSKCGSKEVTAHDVGRPCRKREKPEQPGETAEHCRAKLWPRWGREA